MRGGGRTHTEKALSLELSSRPARSLTLEKLVSIQTPLKRRFPTSWGQMAAATTQHWSLYLTFLIHPAEKATILESALFHSECLHRVCVCGGGTQAVR